MSITIKTLADAYRAGLRKSGFKKSEVSAKIGNETASYIYRSALAYRNCAHTSKIKTTGRDPLNHPDKYKRMQSWWIERRENKNLPELYRTDRRTYAYEQDSHFEHGYWDRGRGRNSCTTRVSDGCYLREYGPAGMLREEQVKSPAQAKKILTQWCPAYSSVRSEELAEIRVEKKLVQIAVEPCYKMVARRDDGTMVSIYDGKTEYDIGKIVHAPLTVTNGEKICHLGGIFVHAAAGDAIGQEYPDNSAASDLPRVLLHGYVWGRKNESGKIAAECFCADKIVSAAAQTVAA